MDPLSSIKTSSLSLCGIFARLKGNQISPDKALEECLKFTQDIDNNACLLEAGASNARKCNAKFAKENYRLKQEIKKLEKKNVALEEKVQKINLEKNKLDVSLSSLFSDDDGDHDNQNADDSASQHVSHNADESVGQQVSQHADD
jgi:predicted nuclease with TOPRIM domain